MLSSDERQSLYDQLRGTGGWRPPTSKRAIEIEEELDRHYEEEGLDALCDIQNNMNK